MGLFGSDNYNVDEFVAEGQSSHVSNKRVAMVKDILQNGEKVYHTIRGPHAGVGVRKSQSESSSIGTAGFATCAVTNQRIIIIVPHITIDDRYTISYGNLNSAEFSVDGVLAQQALTFNTGGKSYFISPMGDTSKSDIDELLSFVDKQLSSRSSDNSVEKRLEKVNKLKEDGLISDEEYDEKRRNILDDV